MIRIRTLVMAIADALLVTASVTIACGVRFGLAPPETEYILVLAALPWIVCTKLFAVALFGLERWSFRYAGLDEMKALLAAVSLGTIIGWAGIFVAGPRQVSSAVLLMEPFLTLYLLASYRFSIRLFGLPGTGGRRGSRRRRALIYGAGDAGEMVLREVLLHGSGEMDVAGFIDDDASKLGLSIHGVRVLGNRRELPRAVSELGVEEILIAIPSAPGETIREIIESCRGLEVSFKVVPGILRIIRGEVPYDAIRELSYEDLLGREVIERRSEIYASHFAGKKVLVTGGGGSIGSEIVRQLSEVGAKTIALDISEAAIYQVLTEAEMRGGADVKGIIADIRDGGRMERVFSDERPDAVFHAAAYKHVPLMEEHIGEAIGTNLIGTKTVMEAAERSGAGAFLLISTDKAVEPASVMGATKALAESLVLGRKGRMKRTAVRFGNVLGSSGSVVPKFLRQIEMGGPVTVTHSETTRFFMTIPEAVHLVICASILEEGGLYVLDMGRPVKIIELARNLITLAGKRPGEDVEIVFTGMRPGEKLVEEVISRGSNVRPTRFEGILSVE